MRKDAFTLIELIFVVILMGVLTGIGFYMSRPSYTKQDAQYTLLKLKEARYRALGLETGDGSCSEAGWVQLTKNALSSNKSPTHEIKSDEPSITYALTPPNDINKIICFDSLGRPHDGNNTSLSTLIHNDFNITFSKSGNKDVNITLFCGTGYAIIPCK